MSKFIEDMVYQCYGHSKGRIRYHLIFITKYRRKCLNDIKESVFEAFKEAEAASHLKIHIMNIDKDHIHMIVSFPPEYSISQTVNRLKQYTTRYLYSHNYDHLRRFFYKKKKTLWSNNYFCSTIGFVSENVVRQYIERQ